MYTGRRVDCPGGKLETVDWRLVDWYGPRSFPRLQGCSHTQIQVVLRGRQQEGGRQAQEGTVIAVDADKVKVIPGVVGL